MFHILRTGLALVLMIIISTSAGCGLGSDKTADHKRQAQLEQILLDIQALRERGATNREWSERAEEASQEFPQEKIDALQAEATYKCPYKQLHLWCIRDRMAKMFRTSRTGVSAEERDYENNLRESAKLLAYPSKLPPLPKVHYPEDDHPDEIPGRTKSKPAPIAARPILKRPEGPLFYPGVSQIPNYIPRMTTAPVNKDGESGEPVLRLSQVEYLQGHWYGWVNQLKEYQNSMAPLEVSDDPLVDLLKSAEADLITWNLMSKSSDCAFQMGVEHGQRDCQRRLLEHQKKLGFELAKRDCAKSLESLYLPSIDGSATSNGLIDPRTLPAIKKPSGKVALPMDTNEPPSEQKP